MKLAQFVARNGPEFEEMTKQKQRDNPKFEFLFGGPFHQYYVCQVKAQHAGKSNEMFLAKIVYARYGFHKIVFY